MLRRISPFQPRATSLADTLLENGTVRALAGATGYSTVAVHVALGEMALLARFAEAVYALVRTTGEDPAS